MKQKQNMPDFVLPSHQFILTPQHLKSSHRLHGLYHLQLEKGCQRISQVKEVMQFQGAKDFLFRSKEGIAVKAFKEKNMVYSWSVYKYEDGVIEYIDVLKFDLHEYYCKYIQELRNYPIEYGKILQYKSTNRENMGRGWISMKSHLKHYRFHQQISNTAANLTLQFSIEIKNELDHLTELEIQKYKANKRMAAKNEKNQDQTQAKSYSSIKIDSADNEDSSLKNRPKDLQAGHCQQEGIMCLPLKEFNIKNWTVLSDIIQASNEQSHQYGDRTDRSDRKPSELGLNSQITPKRDFLKTKSFHFVGDKNSESSEFRRNNSLQAIKGASKVQFEDQDGRKEEVKQPYEEELTNTSTIIKQDKQENVNNYTGNGMRIRLLVFFIFILFMFIFFPCTTILKRKLEISSQLLGSNRRIKKHRLF